MAALSVLSVVRGLLLDHTNCFDITEHDVNTGLWQEIGDRDRSLVLKFLFESSPTVSKLEHRPTATAPVDRSVLVHQRSGNRYVFYLKERTNGEYTQTVHIAASSLWCNVVNYQGLPMKKTQRSGTSTKMKSTPTVRASISFPPALYETLEDIAKQKKVSLAWVVRDAADRYVSDRSVTAGEPTRRK
jgi:hypothetical protein